MPTYEYRCENGHTFEVIQPMADDPVETCEECGAPVERVFHPVAVHFKGSGFYTTDYAGKSKSDDGTSDSKGDESKPPKDSKSDSGASSDSGSGDKGSKAKSGSSD